MNKKNYNEPDLQKTQFDLIFDQTISHSIDDILEPRYTIEKYLSEEIPANFIPDMLDVANDWFWIDMDKKDIEDHIYKSKYVFLLRINWKIIWFSSISTIWDFTYRFWTVIKQRFQSYWLYKMLNIILDEENWKHFLRTQNVNVIKSLSNTFDNVMVWKEALLFMSRNIWISDINDFMISHWDKKWTLDTNWIFRWVYQWRMWDKSRVTHIDSTFYDDFYPDDWDSLLVAYFNN